MDATRREFIAKAGGGLAAILVTQSVPAMIVNSSLCGKACNFLEDDNANYTAIDYAQENLVLLFDGIENDGFGKSDKNATTWMNCMGGAINPTVNGIWNEKSLVTTTNRSSLYRQMYQQYSSLFPEDCETTIEFSGSILADPEYVSSYPRMIFNPCQMDRLGGLSWDTRSRRIGAYVSWNSDRGVYVDDYLKNGKPSSFSAVGHQDGSWDYYMNGVLKKTDYSVGNFKCNDKVYFSIGIQSSTSQTFCCRLYNRCLSASEVKQNYKIDKKRFSL